MYLSKSYSEFTLLSLILLFSVSLINISCSNQNDAANQSQSYDLIIRNGTIHNGLGENAYTADIAILKDQIVKISPQLNATAHKRN